MNFDPEGTRLWLESQMYDWPCHGWGTECTARVNPITENLFGECSLCSDCYSLACEQFIDALSKLDPCD